MDPITAVFAAYLQFLIHPDAASATDADGRDPQALIISYQGVDVPFRHQLWEVDSDSVCAGLEADVAAFSNCSVTAKNLFTDLCTELKKAPGQHWYYQKARDMYCSAADSYQATIAVITIPAPPAALESAKQRCNMAILNAAGSSQPSLLAEQKEACDEYQRLR